MLRIGDTRIMSGNAIRFARRHRVRAGHARHVTVPVTRAGPGTAAYERMRWSPAFVTGGALAFDGWAPPSKTRRRRV